MKCKVQRFTLGDLNPCCTVLWVARTSWELLHEFYEFYSKHWVTFLIIMFSELKFLNNVCFWLHSLLNEPYVSWHCKWWWILALKYFSCQEFTLLWWCTFIDFFFFFLIVSIILIWKKKLWWEKKIIKSGQNYFTFSFFFFMIPLLYSALSCMFIQ